MQETNIKPMQCEYVDKETGERCTNDGNPCFLTDYESDTGFQDEPSQFFCSDHVHSMGFCEGCGYFYGGIEDFDFGDGFCEWCKQILEEELEDMYVGHTGEQHYDDYEYGVEPPF